MITRSGTLTITKFPRVTLDWDAESLKVTQECLNDIKTVVDAMTLNDFNEKYGHVFARRVQLGGCLSCSEKRTADEDSSSQEQTTKLKGSAAASISSSFAQASVEASHEKGKTTGSENSKKNLSSSIAWEATGGDTLLCNK